MNLLQQAVLSELGRSQGDRGGTCTKKIYVRVPLVSTCPRTFFRSSQLLFFCGMLRSGTPVGGLQLPDLVGVLQRAPRLPPGHTAVCRSFGLFLPHPLPKPWLRGALPVRATLTTAASLQTQTDSGELAHRKKITLSRNSVHGCPRSCAPVQHNHIYLTVTASALPPQYIYFLTMYKSTTSSSTRHRSRRWLGNHSDPVGNYHP